MTKVLIVEDDELLAAQVAEELRRDAWVVEIMPNMRDALALLSYASFDLIILDWELPDGSGFELCRRQRKEGRKTPIIFLTGQKGIDEKEMALYAGADDYLTKPFNIRELKARMHSVLRRGPQLQPDDLEISGFRLDFKGRKLSTAEATISLSLSEIRILRFFMMNLNTFYSSSDVFKAIWESDADSTEQTVRQHISVLRKKMSLANMPELIETVRGLGYRIEQRKGTGE